MGGLMMWFMSVEHFVENVLSVEVKATFVNLLVVLFGQVVVVFQAVTSVA